MNHPDDRQEQTDANGTMNTLAELIDWILDHVGSVKELALQQAEKFKRKIQRFKKLNGMARSNPTNE